MAEVLKFNTARISRRSDKSERLKAGRKKSAEWLQHVEGKIRAGDLIDFDGRFARELTNYPSATLEGRTWAGQDRLAKALSRTTRTVYASQRRLQSAGCLVVEHRGCNRTNRYVFCVDGCPTFPELRAASLDHPDRKPASGPDRKQTSDHNRGDRKPASDESSLNLLSLQKAESPPNPPAAAAQAEKSQGYPIEAEEQPDTLCGEVLGPEAEITFNQFWAALRQADPGPAGPASAAWRKLSTDDRRAIGNLIGPHGLDLDSMWATTWLKDRRWEQSRLSRSSIQSRRDAWADAVAELQEHNRGAAVELKPHSPEWTEERDRMIAAGESVKLMDSWARDGRGWTVRIQH